MESQECLFSQIKQTSLRETNRKPENVLPTILLSFQAKKKVGVGNAAMKGQESMVGNGCQESTQTQWDINGQKLC